MKAIVFAVISLTALAAIVAYIGPAYGQPSNETAPIFVRNIPSGYRDWRLVSVAHEEGSFNSFAAVLGNDVAIKAYREGTLPFPDGAIIASLHYSHTASEENNKVFGRSQSFIAGAPTNVQFMVKDSSKYAATGGWGFAHFKDGKPADDDFMNGICLRIEKDKVLRNNLIHHYL